MSYNIITKSLETKLNGYSVSSMGAGNYITLLSAPPLANVYLQINDNTSPKIPFNEGDSLEAIDINRIYITADVVVGGKLVFGQSNAKDFKIIPAPKVKDIEEIGKIGEFDDVLLKALDKIINPYEEPTTITASTSVTAYVTMLDKILNCDKINLHYIGSILSNDSSNGLQFGHIDIFLDDKLIAVSGGYNYQSGIGEGNLSLQNIKGKKLTIKAYTASEIYHSMFSLQEFTKKA